MGRVYDALRRAESAQRHNHKLSEFSDRQTADNASVFTPKTGQEHPWDASSFTASPLAIDSASTAHTAETTGGPALPGGPASRDVGATLGAVGSARAVRFMSQDILAARVEPHLVAIVEPRSPECEQFRSLRTKLLEAGERKRARVFVVTSPGVGEGKTLTALNLGWLMAQTDGVTALVIDADLRRPCVADYLDIESDRGLSEVLTGATRLTEAIVKLRPAGLHVLPGGAAREDVAELLSGPRFARLLDEARKLFDYIIIDAPPLGIFTDANLLINRADAALLVVRASKTRAANVERLLEQMPRERVLGVVLNRAEAQPDRAAYYYRARYHHAVVNEQLDEIVDTDSAAPEMIYIEEDLVS